MNDKTCPDCEGKRLSPTVLSVLINGKNIHDFTEMSVLEALDFINSLVLNETESKIAELIIREIRERLSFLKNVGLDYLTLSRKAGTLSGGEAQRIRLATQIGSKLTGVLYVLDEPSIGLHQRDNQRLINSLLEMRDLGNSLIVVEHDTDTMLAADYLDRQFAEVEDFFINIKSFNSYSNDLTMLLNTDSINSELIIESSNNIFKHLEDFLLVNKNLWLL
jgi:excinuclease ABC subunit A